LTKAFTSTLAGILVDQSVMSWQTTPLDVWPELAETIHPGFRDITLRQLLSHTSGMRRADEVPAEFDQNAPGTTMERRRRYAAVLLSEPPAGPDNVANYSNGGYIVAGAMLETITSTPWETLVAQQVFGPLGMLDSGFGAPGSVATVDQPWGHWDHGTFFEAVPPGPGADNPDTMGPAGTIHTTLSDYARFMLAHIAGARGTPGLLTTETFSTLHSPVSGGVALGWGVSDLESWAQGPVLMHDGSNLRWYSVVRLAPALDAGVMMVANAGPGRAAAAIDSLDDIILERFRASR
jgi:CubicO group peptidase (beta-lactamase class C family)